MQDPAGEAWDRWTSTLGELSSDLGADRFPSDDRGRAEGIRHLARQAQFALRGELEHSDVRHPRLHRYELPWSQWGAPNPDNVYHRCAIDPAGTYLLSGRVEGVHETLVSLVEGDMHLDENSVFGEVALSDLAIHDGRLELLIAPAGVARDSDANHLATEPEARMLLIRQYLWDWSNEPVASFTIERLDDTGDPEPPGGAEVAAALDRASRWLRRSVSYWADYVAASRELLEHNTFTAPRTPPGGAPSIAYGGGCWELSEDEALLVEHEVPSAHYWNWSIHQLHWFDSGPWDQRAMSRNGHQCHVDPDGIVRLVIAHTDPGAPNWLDTNGRPIGMAVYRYVGADTTPVPRAAGRPPGPAARPPARRPPDHHSDAATQRAERAPPSSAATLELTPRCPGHRPLRPTGWIA